MSKLIALLSGGDWYDASVEHLKIPDNMNLQEEYDEYRKWYVCTYKPNLKTMQYMTFAEYLRAKGATETDEIIEVWEDDLILNSYRRRV